nr:hypothetical protein [Tanacetum cinerariifolium]
AVVHGGQRQLVGVGGFQALIVVADGVVARARHEAREGQHRVVGGVGEFLVAPNALLGHHIGVGAAQAGGPVFVVDIDHQGHLPNDFARLYPTRVLELGGRVQVQQQFVAFQQVAGPLAHDDSPPRRADRRNQVGALVHRGHDGVRLGRAELELGHGVVAQPGFAEAGVEAVGQGHG